MSLKQILKSNSILPSKKQDEPEEEEDIIDKERILKNLDKYQAIIAYWRWYPDKFVDFLCSLNPDNIFHLYPYQRLYLRAVFRHRYVYATFVRAWSKSFMSVLSMILRAILFPGANLASAAGGKEQSASILRDKTIELVKLIPALEKEIMWETRGATAKTLQNKDSVQYVFRNGSIVRNIAATESSRGQRTQSLVLEECVGINGDILNQVLLPTLNVSRKVRGQEDPNELLNKSQIYMNFFGQKVTKTCYCFS